MRWVALPGRGCVRPPGSSPNPLRPGLCEGCVTGQGRSFWSRPGLSPLWGRRWDRKFQAADHDLVFGDHPAPNQEPTESHPVGTKDTHPGNSKGFRACVSGIGVRYPILGQKMLLCTCRLGNYKGFRSSVWTGDRDQCIFFSIISRRPRHCHTPETGLAPPACMPNASATQKCLWMRVTGPQQPVPPPAPWRSCRG